MSYHRPVLKDPNLLPDIGVPKYKHSNGSLQHSKRKYTVVDIPNLVSIRQLAELVPGTSQNFWYQRSRLGKIPGQQRCGRFVIVDLDVFFDALRAGKIGSLKSEAA